MSASTPFSSSHILSTVQRLAGLIAIGAAVAMLVSFVQPDRTWIAAFNVLTVPVAAVLGFAFGRGVLPLALPIAAAGIAMAVLWGTRSWDPASEPAWLALAALWWLGLGILFLPRRRALAAFTLLLAVVGAFDTYVTAAGIGQPLLALAGLKLLLTPVWLLWLGAAMVRRPFEPAHTGVS